MFATQIQDDVASEQRIANFSGANLRHIFAMTSICS